MSLPAVSRLGVLMLVVATSGVLPLAVICLEEAHGCGEACARCFCKNRPAPVGLRAACPCCQPRPLAAGPASQLLPAILPAPPADIGIEPTSDPVSLPREGRAASPRTVPHPPPRTLAV